MMCVLPNKTPAAFNFPCLLAVNIGVNRNILAIVLTLEGTLPPLTAYVKSCSNPKYKRIVRDDV